MLSRETQMPNDDWNVLWTRGLAAENPPSLPTILCVDDHTVSRELLVSILQESGFQVVSAENGLEGVEQAKRWQPDLILMDLRMPRMDGFEAISILRATPATEDTPIIVVSAWASAKHRQRSKKAGADEHLSKPINYRLLMTVIRRHLRKNHKEE